MTWRVILAAAMFLAGCQKTAVGIPAPATHSPAQSSASPFAATTPPPMPPPASAATNEGERPPPSTRERETRLSDAAGAISDDAQRLLYIEEGAYTDPHRAAYLVTVDLATLHVLRRHAETSEETLKTEAMLGTERWWRLERLEASPSAGNSCRTSSPQIITDGDIVIRFDAPMLDGTRQGERFLHRDLSAWASRRDDRCKDANALFLSQAHVDHDRTVMLTRLAYCGSDVCPEPADRNVLVRLPGRR